MALLCVILMLSQFVEDSANLPFRWWAHAYFCQVPQMALTQGDLASEPLLVRLAGFCLLPPPSLHPDEVTLASVMRAQR
jgi:hypothetical protein